MVIALTPTSTAQRNTNQRLTAFGIVDTSNSANEVEIRSPGAQASNLQNGNNDPSDKIEYGTALSRETPILCVINLASQIYHAVYCGSKFWIRTVVYNGLASDRHSIVQSMSIKRFHLSPRL